MRLWLYAPYIIRCVRQERIFKRGSVCCSVCRLSIHMSLKPPQKSQILALSNCSDVTHQTEHSQGCLEVVLSVFPSIYQSNLSSLFSICLASSQCTQRHRTHHCPVKLVFTHSYHLFRVKLRRNDVQKSWMISTHAPLLPLRLRFCCCPFARAASVSISSAPIICFCSTCTGTRR